MRTATTWLVRAGWIDREAQIGKTHRTGDDGTPWRLPSVYRWGEKALGAFSRFSHWMRKKIALMRPTAKDPVRAVLERSSSQMENRRGSVFHLGGDKRAVEQGAAQMALELLRSRPLVPLPALSAAARALFRRSDTS